MTREVHAYIRPKCRIIEPPSFEEVSKIWKERFEGKLERPPIWMRLIVAFIPFCGSFYRIYEPSVIEEGYCKGNYVAEHPVLKFNGKLYDWESMWAHGYRTLPGIYKTGDRKYNA